MQRMMFLALAICAIGFATGTAWAEDPKEGSPRPQPPHRSFDPARLFDRLDADKEGVISLDKLPERLPERLKMMLTKADADGDGKVSREEFKAAVMAARERVAERRKEAMAKDRPARPERPDVTKGRSRKGARPESMGRPGKAGPPRPSPAPHRKPMPDLKALFARMDRDKSGELSLEEFTAGMRRLREHFARQHAPVRPQMGPHAWRPMGPHMHPQMGRHAHPPMGPPAGRPGWSWHRHRAGPPRGPAAKPAETKVRERPEPPRRTREERPETRPERSRRPEARPERPRRPRSEKPEGEEPAEKPNDES